MYIQYGTGTGIQVILHSVKDWYPDQFTFSVGLGSCPIYIQYRTGIQYNLNSWHDWGAQNNLHSVKDRDLSPTYCTFSTKPGSSPNYSIKCWVWIKSLASHQYKVCFMAKLRQNTVGLQSSWIKDQYTCSPQTIDIKAVLQVSKRSVQQRFVLLSNSPSYVKILTFISG
jgi:hypothetical protein